MFAKNNLLGILKHKNKLNSIKMTHFKLDVYL